MPETPLLAVRCPIDVLDQIESEKNLTGRSKTDVVIDRLRNSIPSLAVTDRHKLPAIAAIYQVFTSNNNLLYIGITDNLKQDWESHPLYGQFLESDVNSRITWFTDRLPVIDPNLVKKSNSVSDTVNTDYDSHSENMISSNQIEYAIANSEIIKGIQSKLDDVDLRLNESIARLASCLSQRLLTLEKKIDDMEPLLKRERECSITSPLPPSPPDRPAISEPEKKIIPSLDILIASIDGNVEAVEPISAINKPVKEAIENSEKKIVDSLDILIGSIDGTVESVEPNSSIETVASAIEDPEKKIMEPVGGSDSLDTLPVPPITDKTIDQNAIETVPGETDSIEPVTGEGMNPNQAHEYLISKGIEDTSYYYLNKWAKAGVIDTSPQGKNAIKHLILRGKLYFPKTDQP